MGTIMLQAGELPNPSRLAYLQELVTKVVKETVAMDLERRGLDPKVGRVCLGEKGVVFVRRRSRV